MSDPEAKLTELFRDETAKRLDQMDAVLVAIEAGDAGAEAVDPLFRHAHTIKGAAGMLGFDDIRALAGAAEEVLEQVRGSGESPQAMVAPLLRATAAVRGQLTGPAVGPSADGLLDELEACRVMLAAGASAPAEAVEPPAEPAAAPAELAADSGDGPSAPAAIASEVPDSAAHSLRVPAGKIDQLLDIAGEVMQDRRRLEHALGADGPPSAEIADALGAGTRLLEELQDTAVGMRTLPLAMIAGRLPRAVRDLARSAGKDVEFVLTGADTELDRVIIESLSEPLVHLLRNAVVHGVESPAERKQAGKAPRARIEWRAEPRGALVQIVVSDDGRGVTADVAEQASREGSLADLLARAGYSTAGTVTELAGRGVGLDAVRAYAHAVGGSFEIRSEPGGGMDVILLLPLALALVDVLLVERGGEVYGVPFAAIEEVATVTRVLTLGGAQALDVRGTALPVTDLALLIGADAPPLPDRPPALVISVGGRRAVATCDALLGQAQVMIKPLGSLLVGVAGYLGAAILGDGRIALIVEPTALTREPRPDSLTPGYESGTGQTMAPKILVVEDSFTVRELQRGILEAAGYPVVTAHDGVDALGSLDRDPEIALVITDLQMPELDGIQLTRAIRAHATRSTLPVVIVTTLGSEDDRRHGLEAGADAYMAKRSFDQQAMLATVERLVGR